MRDGRAPRCQSQARQILPPKRAGKIRPDPADWKVCRAIFLADTTEEAVKLARNNSAPGITVEGVSGSLRPYHRLLDNSLGHRGILKRDLDMPDADCNLDFWLEEQIIADLVGHGERDASGLHRLPVAGRVPRYSGGCWSSWKRAVPSAPWS